MALIDKLFGRKKTLSQLSATELRREEIIIGKQRDKLLQKIELAAASKKKIFEQGAKTTSPELRKARAQEFELKSKEQMMAARELNIRSKELLTVSRVRLVKENQSGSRLAGRLNIGEADFAKIGGWIEDDAVNTEAYLEKLDELLELGAQSDSDVLNATKVGDAGNELLNLWDQMDKGEMKQDDALKQADDAMNKSADKTAQ
ncbi:MAG: hypothetical protein QM770_15460 [Tepidisphaeraceae bacterium]